MTSSCAMCSTSGTTVGSPDCALGTPDRAIGGSDSAVGTSVRPVSTLGEVVRAYDEVSGTPGRHQRREGRVMPGLEVVISSSGPGMKTSEPPLRSLGEGVGPECGHPGTAGVAVRSPGEVIGTPSEVIGPPGEVIGTPGEVISTPGGPQRP